MHKNKWVCLLLALTLCGCSMTNTNQATSVEDDEYAAILPYETSDTRVKHVGLIQSSDLREEVEMGLMDLSKSYFSPSEVGYKTHVFLDYDELDATDGSRGLLGTLRDDNPNGLNPSSDEDFDTGNGTVTGPLLLADIYELDWYANDELKGISLALVVNGVVGDDIEITDEKMQNYLDVTFSKLTSYMRERFNEITTNIPIYLAAYRLDDANVTGKGGYCYEGYYEGTKGKTDSLSQQWVLVPSTEFKELDSEAYSQFSQFKDEVSQVLPENTYVTGQAKFENDKMRKLKLNVTMHGKTAGEILAVIEDCNHNLTLFESTKSEYLIQIFNNDTVYAIIKRERGSTESTVTTTM